MDLLAKCDFEEVKHFSSTPSPAILANLDADLFGLIHFSVNTFTDQEWGYGNPDDAQLFNPVEFDADQIISAARDGGLKGIVLVCKHHDGFCLWPTKTTEHNITNSPWRDGKGDIVGEFAASCRKHGLKFGVYISPWDRNNKHYGTAEYVRIFEEQIREVLTNYGEIFEMWFDGANGGDGWYGGACEKRNIGFAKDYYNWDHIFAVVRELQPNARIFGGPDLRWCGNERGHLAPESSAMYYPIYHVRGGGKNMSAEEVYELYQCGDRKAPYFVLPECDFPMRRGWFYHPEHDGLSRSPLMLLMDYLHTVGNGGVTSLGLVPDKRGLLTDEDCCKLRGFGEKLKMLRETQVFDSHISGEGEHTFDLPADTPFDLIELVEDIAKAPGEKVEGYTISLDGRELVSGEVIGLRRLRLLPEKVCGRKLTLTLKGASFVRITLWRTNDDLLTPTEDSFVHVEDTAIEDIMDKIMESETTDISIDFDLGRVRKFNGFIMTPDPEDREGLVLRYGFFSSNDHEIWEWLAFDEGFENIQANPIPQRVRVKSTEARYLRFQSFQTAKEGAKMVVNSFAILKED